MEYALLLDRSSNLREIEAEEQTRFVISILESLDIPFDWDSNQQFTSLDKVRLRKVLGQYNASVIDDMNGGMKVYLERDQIAEWKKALFVLKEDLSKIDPKDRLYIEMKCSFSSIFESASDP